MTDEELNALAAELESFDFDPFTNQTADAAASAIRQLMRERDDLRTTALAFVAATAGPMASEWGLKDGEILAHHFDLIAKLGGRTDGFVRIDPKHPPTPS